MVNSPLCVAHDFIQCLDRFLARGQLGKALILIPGILHYFVFLIVIMEGDLDMETFFFFLLG